MNATVTATETVFTSWTYAGVRFLSIPDGSRQVTVIDEHGKNYGAWMTVERFRKLQQAGDPMTSPFMTAGVRLQLRFL